MNKLIIIGNGFDLAHGLKTDYRSFINWYVCDCFTKFLQRRHYTDCLIEMKYASNTYFTNVPVPTTCDEVLKLMAANGNDCSLIYHSNFFFKGLLNALTANNWVDIERFYFQLLKAVFKDVTHNPANKMDRIKKLNNDFNFLVSKLADYIMLINAGLNNLKKLEANDSTNNFDKLFLPLEPQSSSQVKVLNFNYTETVSKKGYIPEQCIIHIHGRAADSINNPIVFGYGDETDPAYQEIEDSGENIYLEHIKSFAYFRTGNYRELLTFINSERFRVSIVGHSCGLSDRVLLNTIFEHKNCSHIEIFYHKRENGTDNFTEITQEISRHFRPANKGMMRSKVIDINPKKIIPQNC